MNIISAILVSDKFHEALRNWLTPTNSKWLRTQETKQVNEKINQTTPTKS